MGLDFGEGHFDRIQIWRIRRQKQEPRTNLLEAGFGFFALMNAKIIQDDDIAWFECRRKLGLDVGVEDFPVHRPVNNPGRGKTETPQACNECLCPPVAKGRIRDETLAARGAPTQSHHLCVHRGFVQENKPMRFKSHPGLAFQNPDNTVLSDIGASAFRGHQLFFYMCSPALSKTATGTKVE